MNNEYNEHNEHGESFFSVNGNIITIEMKGAFNEYGLKSFANRMNLIVDKFQGQGFSVLMNVTKVTGGTPELYLEAENYNKWLNNQNMIAKAAVTDSIVNLAIYKSRVKSVVKQDHKVFDNEPEALEWLRSKS